jgi:hypothetical protein
MVSVREQPLGGDLSTFLNVVDDIYAGDDAFVRALDMEVKDRLHPRRNPFFEHGEGVVLTAFRGDRCVGRATAQVDWSHIKRHDDGAGFFGFFDTVDDPEVAKALLDAAEGYVRRRGMTKLRGPISLSMNEELGCLVEGFDTRPYVYMAHHRPYQGGLIEGAGFAKAKDVIAWDYSVGEVSSRVRRAHAEIKALPEVHCRTLDMRNLERDLSLIVSMFNEAWSDNWGFVPLSEAEIRKMAKDFRLLIRPEITCIVEIHGEPAAFAIAIPNLNELVQDLGGRLLPFGALKLLYRLKVRGAESARLFMLGILPKFRLSKTYKGLTAFMYAEMNDGGRRIGMQRGELSWTLEDNAAINAGIRSMGARPYKRYRVYEKALARN